MDTANLIIGLLVGFFLTLVIVMFVHVLKRVLKKDDE